MNKASTNVLMISLDSKLAMDEGSDTGNVRKRHRGYAKNLSSLHIVVKTSQDIMRSKRKITENLSVYPISSLNRYFFFFDAYKIAAKICKEYSIDIITTQDPFITGLIGWLLKRRYAIPLNMQIVADMIDNKYFIKESILNLILNWLAKLIIPKADTIRVTTLKEKEKLRKIVRDERRIFHVPIFLDFMPFLENNNSQKYIRQEYLRGKFDKIVLTVCRLVKQKGLPDLLKAIYLVKEAYPKALFLIIGSGQKIKNLQYAIARLNIQGNVQLIENMDSSFLPGHFLSSDLFVITSLYEGSCAVILEAMAAGKPVISTAHAGAMDAIIDGETGFIVDFEDSQGLARKIVYLLENEEVASRMGAKGREALLKRFDKNKILQDYLGMFEATVKSRYEKYAV